MNSYSLLLKEIRTSLKFLPENILENLLLHLQQTINYQPVIGIIGKSGSGKSSLCNALFESSVCATDPIQGCTREAQRLTLSIGERRMTIVDLPGLGETPEYDHEYSQLYQQLLPELDLIVWVLRADERAYAADIQMYKYLCSQGADSSRFLFILSHADRVFPANEWLSELSSPSPQQLLSLATVSARVASLFPTAFPVLPVSAVSGWNLSVFVSLMIYALPIQATSAVYTHFRKENCSEDDRHRARADFGQTLGQTFDRVILAHSLPESAMRLISQIRKKIIQLLLSLWDKFF